MRRHLAKGDPRHTPLALSSLPSSRRRGASRRVKCASR
jgi:hypothetical protein